MRFTLGRVVHYYYFAILMAVTFLFAYGAHYYWNAGLLNLDYVSNLYDGTSKVNSVKERRDIDEIKKFVDGDRIKDANKVFERFESDIKDLKAIKSLDEKSTFDDNFKKVRTSLNSLQNSPELSSILNSLNGKVVNFEQFVTEKKWPTLMKMSFNLKNKISPAKLMVGGLYNFDRTITLTQTVSNDLEAMTNFTESSGLQADIKAAIINRLKIIKTDATNLEAYVNEHKNFNATYKNFHADYQTWFKQVEPEIAFKKIQFEKSAQNILITLVATFLGLICSMVLGFMIYNHSMKAGSQQTEKLIIDTIKEGLLPVENKMHPQFSIGFNTELDKYRDYVHRRMTFGAIFQEAMPFASILLDSNLNMIWGNSFFYEQWKLENFKGEDESLSWDFLQRFTNLEDHSVILSALRMSAPGVYKIQVKTNSMSEPVPYEMYVSPVEYALQKRIMIIFYPMAELEEKLSAQRSALISPMVGLIEAQLEERIDNEMKTQVKTAMEKAGGVELYSKVMQSIEYSERIRDELTLELEDLENKVNNHSQVMSELRKKLVESFETQKDSIGRYNEFKTSVSTMFDARTQLEELFKHTLTSARELYKDQNKLLQTADKAERTVDDYTKSVKHIASLKGQFKDLKNSVEEFRSKTVQVLDQLLIFQNPEADSIKIDQFVGKIKIEMKGFERVLLSFNEVVTQLDVTVTKLDMMASTRENIELDPIKNRMDQAKNNLDNAQFALAKIEQTIHQRDEEMITNLKGMVVNLKSEMKRIDGMCDRVGLTSDHLNAITNTKEERV